MGDLDDAIRDHLELKRRRGADPAEVAREEQEALAPVTRGHAVVVPEDLEQVDSREPPVPRNGGPQNAADAAQRAADAEDQPAHEGLGDATQEFRVVHSDSDDWLEEDDDET